MQNLVPRWLLLSFTLSAAGILAGGYWFYRAEGNRLWQRNQDQLQAIAELKVDQILDWRRDHLRNARGIMENPADTNEIVGWLEKPKPETAQNILTRFHSMQKNYLYANICLIDAQQRVRLSLDDAFRQIPEEAARTVESAITERRPALSDLFVSPDTHLPMIAAIAPFYSRQGAGTDPAGAVILLAEARRELYPIIQSWPVPSHSAESLLVRREADSVLYLNELRHQKDAAFNLRIPLSRKEVPAVEVVLGIEGIFVGNDYRNIRVLAGLRRIPNSPWFLIAKMDEDEAMAARREQGILILALITGLLVALLGGTGMIWQRGRKEHYLELYREESLRTKAEADLRESMARLQELNQRLTFHVNRMPLAFIAWNRDFMITEWNPAAERIFGYPAIEAIGKHACQLIVPTVVQPWVERVWAAVLEGGDFASHALNDNVTKEGRHISCEWYNTPLRDVSGAIIGCLSMISDITERKQAEQAVKDSMEQFHSLYDNMEEGVALHQFEFDEAGRPINYRIMDVNPQFERILQIDKRTIVHKLATEAYDVSEAPYLQMYSSILQSGEPLRFETHFLPLGRRFSISACRWLKTGFATIFADITERRLAEEARETLLKSLQEKTEEMEALLYISSHDLRSPLVNIQGFSQRLEKAAADLRTLFEGSSDGDALRGAAAPIVRDRIPGALHYIVASVAKMDGLIGGMLRLSRLGRTAFNPVWLDMNQLVKSSVVSLEHQAELAKACIRIEPLPDCWGEAGQISQVFTNLIDNALKYTDPGRPLCVHVRGNFKGEMAVYCIEDNGAGIKIEYQSKVWQSFTRLDPHGRIPGEGLGLTVVKRIVQRHGGRAWLESVPDKGSMFYISLPREKPTMDPSLHIGEVPQNAGRT